MVFCHPHYLFKLCVGTQQKGFFFISFWLPSTEERGEERGGGEGACRSLATPSSAVDATSSRDPPEGEEKERVRRKKEGRRGFHHRSSHPPLDSASPEPDLAIIIDH